MLLVIGTKKKRFSVEKRHLNSSFHLIVFICAGPSQSYMQCDYLVTLQITLGRISTMLLDFFKTK